jgi:hypothetical protein
MVKDLVCFLRLRIEYRHFGIAVFVHHQAAAAVHNVPQLVGKRLDGLEGRRYRQVQILPTSGRTLAGPLFVQERMTDQMFPCQEKFAIHTLAR